jgi:membrane protein
MKLINRSRRSAADPDPAGDGGLADGRSPDSRREESPAGRDGSVTADERQAAPDSPTDLSGGSWLAALKRSVQEFRKDFLQDHAAALTYYGVLSIFPGILVLVSLLGLVGKSATQPLINSLADAVPAAVRQIFLTATAHLQSGHATAGILAIVGIAAGLWSASGYIAAFMRVSNAIYDVPEGRPFWKTTPIRLGLTLAVAVLLAVSALIVVVTGGLAQRVGQAIGLGSVAVTIWDIAKWPVLLVLVSLMISLLYWASPNARHGFQWVSPGGIIAVVLWLIASGLFTFYVANFSHYNKVYGSIAGVIIFMIWMWISNLAILFGAEFNAELERGRAAAAGVPLGTEPFAELRDTRKLRKAAKRGQGRMTT